MYWGVMGRDMGVARAILRCNSSESSWGNKDVFLSLHRVLYSQSFLNTNLALNESGPSEKLQRNVRQ